jgi:hypothetical protein
MPRVGFEPMIPAFERAKTAHVLDRVATVVYMWKLRIHKEQSETRKKKSFATPNLGGKKH